jgi:serine/threonine protein kinase
MVETTRPGRARPRSHPNLPQPPPGTAPGRCPRCSAPTSADSRFCAQCGQRLTDHPTDFALRDPLIGAIIADRYRLVAKLGQGGMGTVYRVEHVRMGKPLALKLLHGDLARDQTMIHRFSREARAISRLTSRNAVQCFDFGHDNGLFFIVMELLTGRDLGDLLSERATLSPRRTSTILRQAANALTEAHHKHIVHRDLKPENLFICAAHEGEDEVVKVLDFGLAKLRERSMIDTQQGAVMGTPHFMSPEQIEGLDVDHLADVYALGAVAFKLLTGQPPYPSATPLVALYRHLHDPIPRIADIAPHLAPFQPFFDAALAKRPFERFQNVDALAQAFSHSLRDLDPSTPLSTQRRQGLSRADITLTQDGIDPDTLNALSAPFPSDLTDPDHDHPDPHDPEHDHLHSDHTRGADLTDPDAHDPHDPQGAHDDPRDRSAATSDTSQHADTLNLRRAPRRAPRPAAREDSGPERRHLLPTLRRNQQLDLPTRQEFDHFERNLKLRQALRSVTFISIILSLGVFLYWGFALDGFFNFDREQEPNDTLKTASSLRPQHAIGGSLGEPSTVSAQQDQDVFRIEGVEPGKMLLISVTGLEGLDILLEVVSMRGERLLQQDAAGVSLGEVIPNMPMTKDPLFVAVREQVVPGKRPQFRPDLHYSLRVDVRDPLSGEEHEPNNGPSTASHLDDTQSGAGVLSSDVDLDYFLLPKLPADATGVILRLSSVPRVDTALTLLDANGDHLGDSDQGALSEGESLRVRFHGRHVIEPLYALVQAKRGVFHPKLHYQLNFEAFNEPPEPEPLPEPLPEPQPQPLPEPPPVKPPPKKPKGK